MNEKDGEKREATLALATVEEFLAHAVALETEVAERYQEIAESMQVHHNAEVADLFFELASASRKHAASMRERSEGKDLPKIAPWEFLWGDAEAPETPSMEHTHYLMTPYHALNLARSAEIQAQNFYTSAAETTPNAEVRNLALEFAYEEAEHVHLINTWITRYPEPEEGWDFDPDPPGGSA